MTQWSNVAFRTDAEKAPEIRFIGATLNDMPDWLGRAMAAAMFKPEDGRWLDLVNAEGADGRIILIGRSASADWIATGGHLVDAMRLLSLKTVRLPYSGDIGGADAFERLLLGATLHSYRLVQTRRDPKWAGEPETLLIDPRDESIAQAAQREATPANRARAWVEQPANLLTPAIFADEASEVLGGLGLTVGALGLEELQTLGAEALLAVAAGSANPPRLFVAEYRGASDREGWDAVLVGKGLTFDGGGLNIKQRPIIEKMKFDMGGAAAVLGAIECAARRDARVNLAVVVPMTENSIGPAGYRPGDVIGSLAGLSIEVQNTDAEGRLVLADGITYALREYDPEYLVDVATLTGAVMSALHEEFAAIYTGDEGLAAALAQAGDAVDEPLWRMPLSSRQDYLVDSTVADVANMGAPGFLGVGVGSSIAGAKFLQRFVDKGKWAHLDIAGTAWATRKTTRSGPGATGFGVALLDRWITSLERSVG